MFLVDWIQHAAGHGGFHSGRASVGPDAGFNWIFDCGAKNASKLETLVQTWTMRNQEPVHWLFISHFDADHVSGLDTLMSRTIIRDVMVPYVNERELVLQLLYEVNRGNLQRTFFELVADPGAFFLSRGAERVTFLQGSRRFGTDPDVTPSRPRDPESQSGWRTEISPVSKPLSAPRGFQGPLKSASRIQLVEGPCKITVVHGSERLCLKPYRSLIGHNTHQGLMADLQSVVRKATLMKGRPGLGDLAFAIAHHARTAAGRKALQILFAKHVASSNRSSLSLLSTPLLQSEMSAHWHVSQPQFTVGDNSTGWSRGTGAWMNTGDAELLLPSDLGDWEANYRSDLANVRVLALPHHGSDKNSDGTLQNLCPAALLVAHTRAGARKHPGAEVSNFAGSRLALVTGEPGTAVHMRLLASL